MHLLSSIPGGWTEEEGVIQVSQPVGDWVFLSSADTDLYAMDQAYASLSGARKNLPSLRLCQLSYLRQELSLDNYVADVLCHAKWLWVRTLGGEGHYPYLVQRLSSLSREKGVGLLFLPSHTPDLHLMQLSSVDMGLVHACRACLEEGGVENYRRFLDYFVQQVSSGEGSVVVRPPKAKKWSESFLYERGGQVLSLTADSLRETEVLVLAYRSYYLSGRVAWLERFLSVLSSEGLRAKILFVAHLREASLLRVWSGLLKESGVGVLLSTTGFVSASLSEGRDDYFFVRTGIPSVQCVVSSGVQEAWWEGSFGLSPIDLAMHVVLPEMEGRILSSVVSFKKLLPRNVRTQSDLVDYVPYVPSMRRVSKMARGWLSLRRKPNAEKNVALVLPNYPNKDGRLANGVGLDTPESCIRLLKVLKEAGYAVVGEPASVEDLIQRLTSRVTNDLDSVVRRPAEVFLSEADYARFYRELSGALRQKVEAQWGDYRCSPYFSGDGFLLTGFLCGRIFIGLQPARGYHEDAKAIYHSPDLPPPHAYLAHYFWLRRVFCADAVVHVGKHGNLEWLPGKSLALAEESCFPAALLPTVPHFYPFIINDPGEGAQAKRRTQAVVVDHLIPPMTRAETHDELLQLERLIEEYYEAAALDQARASALKKKIQQRAREAHLQEDLGEVSDIDELLLRLDAYLCELKEAQIRGGLHVLGCCPEGEDAADLLVALHRSSISESVPGLLVTMAEAVGVPELLDKGAEESFGREVLGKRCRHYGQVRAVLEGEMKRRVGLHVRDGWHKESYDTEKLQQLLGHMLDETWVNLQKTEEELSHLLRGLSGYHVPSGPSGAPTRCRPDLLPTGRNFYSVDVRALPTEMSYDLGKRSAEQLVQRYVQSRGEYPRALGLSVWGTSTMRTGGDDISQALALLGAKPMWRLSQRRVVDTEIVNLDTLGRPRVDVMLRISGFFRDAFPGLIRLFQACVERVAMLDEPSGMNPIRARYLLEKEQWYGQGLSMREAHQRALYRVFGSAPQAYGTGLQALIDERNWKTTADLARVYTHWSSTAYDAQARPHAVRECFENRLRELQIVMHNQDNREHDLLDSDDYYQFQGGMANAVRHVRGRLPEMYFGDHAHPEQPRVKGLKQELLKVYRSRVVNPKWIRGMRKHSYKGGFEMAATLDYLFAYDATTSLVEDFMYEGISRAYLLDEANRRFLRKNNPWALKEMSERLLEAIQRGMWRNPSDEMKRSLRELYLRAETDTEETLSR